MAWSPRSSLAALACLILIMSGAQAQTRHGRPIVVAPVTQPVVATPSPPPNSSVTNAPGVPNTSRPGSIGTGAPRSGLPGESTSAPGFPGPVGQWQK